MTDETAVTDAETTSATGTALPRQIEYVPLDSLKADPRNPKSHDLALIDSSYDRFGVVDVVTVDGRTGYIISGHGRTTALRDAFARGDVPPEGVVVEAETGAWLVPINSGWASKNDAEAAAALIAMNRVTEMGGWVDENLLTLLQEISDSGAGFDGVGYSDTDMDDLKHLLEDVPDLDDLAAEWDPDSVPTSGGAVGVTIKLLDAGAIDAWHDIRDTVKTDDDAMRQLLGLAPAAPAAKGKKASSRAADPTHADAEANPGAPIGTTDGGVGTGSLSQRYAAEDPALTPGLEADDTDIDTAVTDSLEGPIIEEDELPDDGLDWDTAATLLPGAEIDAEVEIDLTGDDNAEELRD